MASRVGSFEDVVDRGSRLGLEHIVALIPFCRQLFGGLHLLVVGSWRGWSRSLHPVNMLEIAGRVGLNSDSADRAGKERNLVRDHRSRRDCDRKNESRKKGNRLEVHDDSGPWIWITEKRRGLSTDQQEIM